jgi:peptidoglycan LD-endopeptidase CwlK
VINSRDLGELLPVVQEKAQAFLDAAKAQHIDVIVTSTYRDLEQQAALYAEGRSAPGTIKTNAKPGESWHNWRCAFDFVGMRNGKCVWESDDPMWQHLGELGESVGLEWAGRWVSFTEKAHMQYTGGLTLAQLQAGAQIA